MTVNWQQESVVSRDLIDFLFLFPTLIYPVAQVYYVVAMIHLLPLET